MTAPRTRQHEKRNLSPVYRLSIARPDSKRIPGRDGPSAASRRPRQVPRSKLSCIILQKAKSWQTTQRGLEFDVTISLSAPGKRSTRSPSEPAPAAASPLSKRAVWCLALNRIWDMLWWGRSFGAAGKRASSSARVGRASAAKPGRNKGSKLGRLSSRGNLQTAIWQLVKRRWWTPAVVAHRHPAVLPAVISDVEVLTHARKKKRGTAPSSRLLPLPGLILCLPARQHHNNILFGACQGHQVR